MQPATPFSTFGQTLAAELGLPENLLTGPLNADFQNAVKFAFDVKIYEQLDMIMPSDVVKANGDLRHAAAIEDHLRADKWEQHAGTQALYDHLVDTHYTEAKITSALNQAIDATMAHHRVHTGGRSWEAKMSRQMAERGPPSP